MSYPTLERAGLLFNMLAGILFGLDFFVAENLILWINNQFNIFAFNAKAYAYIFFYICLASEAIILVIMVISEKIPDIDISRFKKLSKIVYYVVVYPFIALLVICYVSFWMVPIIMIISDIIRLSPKGALGSIGIICFIIGNVLQLLATFKK